MIWIWRVEEIFQSNMLIFMEVVQRIHTVLLLVFMLLVLFWGLGFFFFFKFIYIFRKFLNS